MSEVINGTSAMPAESVSSPANPLLNADPTKIAQKPPDNATPAGVKSLDSQRFASLAKKEKANFRLQQELKAKEAELAEREKRFTDNQPKKAKNPIEALQAAGYTYKEATDFILNGEKDTPDLQLKEVRGEVDYLKKKLEDDEKSRLENEKSAAQKQHEEVIAEFKSDIKDFVSSNAGEYELINLFKADEIVYALIAQKFEESGKDGGTPVVLPIKDAAGLVEEYLEAEVMKALETGRIKKKLSPNPEAKGEGDPKLPKEPIKEGQQPTITNKMTPTTPGLLPEDTERDRVRRAMAALG